MGGIAREMDVDEDDVQQAEKYYKDIRKEIGGWANEQSELYGTPGDIINKAGYIERSLDWVTEIL